jgi:hypothetical protein
MHDTFYRMSQVLTGEDGLDPQLSAQYLERLTKHARWGSLAERLLTAFEAAEVLGEDALEREVLADPELGPAARQVIVLWYTGAFVEEDGEKVKWSYGNADHYFAGLLWKVARAHPPMLSGGYFGHWHYPPED